MSNLLCKEESDVAYIMLGASSYLGRPIFRPPAQQSITLLPVSFLSFSWLCLGGFFLSPGDCGRPGELNWVLEGGPETIAVERSSAQESSSDQLDVTHHHLFRPDKDWVYTKCASEFRPVFFVFKLFLLTCSGSWPIWPYVWLCICLFLFSHCLLFATSHPSLPLSVFCSSYLVLFPLLASCLFAITVNYI